MNPQKNYIDERGNYHNVENLTLTQIHDRASEEGYRLGKAEAIAAADIFPEVVEIIRDILPQVVEIIRDILPQVVEIAKQNKYKAKPASGCKNCKYESLSTWEAPCNECKRACLDKYEKDGQADE